MKPQLWMGIALAASLALATITQIGRQPADKEPIPFLDFSPYSTPSSKMVMTASGRLAPTTILEPEDAKKDCDQCHKH